MCSSYEDFLHRLYQYRVRLNLTQAETGHRLGITQSQFSKMELGKTIVPYKTLELLLNMGWDVDFLLTGKKFYVNDSKLSILMYEEEDSEQKLLSAIVWFLEQGIEKSIAEMSFETKCEIEILKMRADGGVPESILYEIRRISGIAQIPMAEKLGVNIKKYRMLEKNKTAPDAELLLRLYEVTGCRPTLLLENRNVEKLIINELWNQLTQPIQKRILALAEQVIWFLKM